jgi:hypothetical protein
LIRIRIVRIYRILRIYGIDLFGKSIDRTSHSVSRISYFSRYFALNIHHNPYFAAFNFRKMKKINFLEHVLPHIVAIGIFLLITLFFFKPVFFDNKTVEQHDIQQFMGSSKSISDYREQTGEEALWTDSMFSGMPAYLVSVEWGNKVIGYLKQILSVGVPHPICNIYLAFVCYYIMLLAFGVRPYLAIAGAIAFGLSSYMIIGFGAGHNGRIGAIALMPLVMAGIHLVFSNKKILGLGVTTAGLALHLRENHVQITYYFMMILAVYGLVMLIEAIRQKRTTDFFKTIALLVPAALIAAGTFFGPMWALNEYSAYSTRGKSELKNTAPQSAEAVSEDGLSREYAFRYSNGILEPFTLLIPNFYGGSSSTSLAENRKSETFQALQNLANSGNEQMVNQLYRFTVPYWGPQQFGTAPYYGGAIMVFLFAVGIAFAERKYVWWLVSVSILGIVLSWGSSFPSFNYFLFDHFPAYSKFRSVTFTIIMTLFAMPLLGLMGLEKLWKQGLDKSAKRKLLITFAATGGLCLVLLLFAGMFSFTKAMEDQLPAWLIDALVADRKSLLRSDAFRSLAFITATFILIYFDVHKKISPVGFYVLLIFMVTVDMSVVDGRYFSENNFKRKRDNTFFAMNEVDQDILQDKSYYRVYNLQWEEARTSYYHHSVGGYHGAKMRRYQDFYDSCISRQTQQLGADYQRQQLDFKRYTAFNLLNIKYIVFGTARGSVMPNPSANGPAWFVDNILKVNSPTEELEKTCGADTRANAVIDVSKFQVSLSDPDSTGTIRILEHKPNALKYESSAQTDGLVVFSEIYYPGWVATIDGKESPVLRADYILRALEVPAGNHTIEFRFEPKPYTVGNKVTTASSWLALLILLGSIGWTLKKKTLDQK